MLSQQLQSANLYVFAVSLLVTTSPILVAEYLEAEADNTKIELRGHKVFWGIVALILVIFQSIAHINYIATPCRIPNPEGFLSAFQGNQFG